MSLTANLRERVRINSVIRIKRSFEGPGSLSVVKGEELKPQDVVGKYQLSAGFVAVKLAKLLSVSNQEALEYLQKKIGDKIYKGELLARKKGLLGTKVVTAPTDGIIDSYDSVVGDLRLKYLPKEIQLTAGVNGIVEEVNRIVGEVIIKTMATEVFGVVGSGRNRSGVLNLVDNNGHLTNEPQITKEMKNHVIVAGALIYKDALQKAIEIGVSGIITGGMNVEDFISVAGSIEQTSRIGTDIGISIFVTEGFGPIPIGSDIFRQIEAYQNKFVFINGNSSRLILPALDPDIIMAVKKIILPPYFKSPERQPEIMTKEIKLGSSVRLIWPPFAGSQGQVIALDQSATTLASGISTYLVTVETGSRKIKVPYPNIELI